MEKDYFFDVTLMPFLLLTLAVQLMPEIRKEMKRTLLFLSLVLVSLFASAQKKGKWHEVEDAAVVVTYDYTYVTDTLVNKSYTRKMELRSGMTTSAFFSPVKFATDSLWMFNPDKYFAEQSAKHASGWKWTMDDSQPFLRTYKNWPEGQLTEFDRFAMEGWTYKENWEKPEWEMQDSVKQVLGYDCQLATANFRGRKWLAWFTMDIPLSDGPWKLCGLPGLILEAQDSKGHYSFSAIGLENGNGRKVICYQKHPKYDYTISHDEYLKKKYRSLHQSNVQNKLESLGVDVHVKPTPYVSHHDLLETNFPH